MATRPDVDAFVTYLGLSAQVGANQSALLTDVLNATIVNVEARLRADAIPDDPDSYPEDIRLYVLQLSAQRYKRRESPEGGTVFAPGGSVVFGEVDESLVEPYLRLGGFA